VPSCKTTSGLIMVMVGDVCRGKGSFSGCHYLMEDLFSSVPAYVILHTVNSFVLSGAYLLAASGCYPRRVTQA
jgi:hypothetical protein